MALEKKKYHAGDARMNVSYILCSRRRKSTQCSNVILYGMYLPLNHYTEKTQTMIVVVLEITPSRDH